MYQGYLESCPINSLFATDSKYGYCCNTKKQCVTPTTCIGKTKVGPRGFSSTCGPSQSCSAIKVVDSKGSLNTKTFVGCFQSGLPSTWYRAAFRVTTSKGKLTTITTAIVPTASKVPNAGNSLRPGIDVPALLAGLALPLAYVGL